MIRIEQEITSILDLLRQGHREAAISRIESLIAREQLLGKLESPNEQERALAALALAIDNHLAIGSDAYSFPELEEDWASYQERYSVK